jgi:dolichol-phosphate mannosyltransferase
MDCDLQEPPEAIGALYAKAREGYEIVLTARRARRESRLRSLLGRIYVGLRSAVVGIKVRGDHGTLSMLSRAAVDAFLQIRDRDREYVLILYWLGFERAVVEFDHAERFEGASSHTPGALLKATVEGLFFQTTRLLRWVVYAGLGVAFAGFAAAGYYLLSYFLSNETPAGFTSLVVLLLILGGFAILSIGVVGLYVGKVFDQSKERPLYVIDERLRIDDESARRPARERVPASGRD